MLLKLLTEMAADTGAIGIRIGREHQHAGLTETAHSPADVDWRLGPPERRAACCCLPHTCLPVYRGLLKITATVRNVHAPPSRCRFRCGSTSDGHGTPRSVSSRAIPAMLGPANRCANIHCTCGPVAGSGSNRSSRRPQRACARFGCGPASTS